MHKYKYKKQSVMQDISHCMFVLLRFISRKPLKPLTLCRKILFRKLASFGLSLKSINLIKSYLTERKQLVSLYGKKLTLLSLDIGVILGSVIGPLLFSMYINDITKIGLNCKTILYASDTYFIFSHKNLAELEKIVNQNMIILTEWLLENKLVVSYKKSHFMIIGSKNSCNFKSVLIITQSSKLQRSKF
jgi:hypothetical protein